MENALWLIFGKMAQMGLQFLLGLLTARYLGPGDFGLIQYAGAYTGFFAPICTLGLSSVLVKELTDAPEKSGEILGTALALRGISGMLSACAIGTIVWVADGGEPAVFGVAVFSSLAMALQLFEVFHDWFRSRLQSRFSAAAAFAAYCLSSGYKLCLLMTGKGVIWFAFASVLEQLCAGICLLTAYLGNGGGKLTLSFLRAKRMLKKSVYFILPSLLAAVCAQTDKIMLKHLMGQALTGCYGAAMSVSSVWCFVLSAIIDSMQPGILQTFQENREQYLLRNKQLYGIVIYLSGAVSVLLCLCAEPLIRVLYGAAYAPAVQALRILTWNTGFSYLGVARNTWMVCENRQKHLIWVYLAAAGMNAGLNRLLIPLWGIAGAAAASLAAQMVSALAAPLLIPPLRPNARLMVQAITLRDIFAVRKENAP